MYALTEQQIDFILRDIKNRGVEMEDLQLNLLDHICCVLETNGTATDEFEKLYAQVIRTFFRNDLREIEEETIQLLTFKNYYSMKKAMIATGTISVVSFMFGSLFKIMHWPGASVLLVLGIGIMCFVFLPLVFILKTREAGTQRDKMVFGSGTLVGVLYCIAVLGAIMHWPIAKSGNLWIVTCALSMLVFAPLYFFAGIRKPEKRVNTIITTILIVVASGLHFTLVNLRPVNPEIKMYSYLQNEQLLEQMQVKPASASSVQKAPAPLVDEIQTKCNQIKGIILKNSTGQSVEPGDLESKNIVLEEGNLGSVFYPGSDAWKLLGELRTAVSKYNSSKSAGKLPVEHSILEIAPDRLGSYTNLFFLTELTQLQMFLTQSENMMMAEK